MQIDQWNWMADYCYKNRWNPHDSHFWKVAEEKYKELHVNASNPT